MVPDGEPRPIWFVVHEDEVDPAMVTAHSHQYIDTLKNLVNERRQDIPTSDMLLWKVNHSIPVSRRTIEERKAFDKWINGVHLPDPDSPDAYKEDGDVQLLDGAQLLSSYWNARPPHGLHVIVQQLSQRPRKRRRTENQTEAPPKPTGDLVNRDSTVAALYARLQAYGFIQVRGTPGSGKTTLARLLGQHIYNNAPDIRVIWVNGWLRDDVKKFADRRNYLKSLGWQEGAKTVFIFDEAQLSYWDTNLWNDFFKDIKSRTSDRWTIIFASYGSPTSRFKINGTLISLKDMQRVTLRPIDHYDDLPAVGLLFSREEFHDLMAVLYPQPHFFSPSFFESVFNITGGHVGAICDFLEIIAADDSYRRLKHVSGELYTWERFLRMIGPRDLLRKLDRSASIFARGLPEDQDLQDPVVARIFSAVLCYNYVTSYDKRSTNDGDGSSTENNVNPDDISTPNNNFTSDEIKRCFRQGWLHSDKLDVIGQPNRVGYFFPSSLHRWFVEWKLWDTPKSSSTYHVSPQYRRLASGGTQQIPAAGHHSLLP